MQIQQIAEGSASVALAGVAGGVVRKSVWERAWWVAGGRGIEGGAPNSRQKIIY